MQKIILKPEPEITFPQADKFERIINLCELLSKNEIIQIMKESNLNNIWSEETFYRRSSTVSSWINWIVKLINN